MKGLYIGSTGPWAGKNLAAMAVGLWLQREGLRVGYMKPLGARPKTVDEIVGDEDAFFVQEVLGLEDDPALVTPVITPANLRTCSLADRKNEMERVREAYETLSRGRDIMLVGGCGEFLHSGRHAGISGPALVRRLGLKALVVDRYDGALHYDALLGYREVLGDALAGVLFNDVPEDYLRDAEEMLVPYLSEHGIPALGIVPRDRLLNAIKAVELAWRLGGRIVSGNRESGRIVEDFLIGTMQVDNFMSHFKQHANSATIVGGDRTDLQLVALEGQCPCLILTGNITPDEIIRTRSEARGVPVIVVREDTYTVARKMEEILNSQKLRELVKIRRAAQMVDNTMDYPALKAQLGF
ncbi:DRTGG domain protein [Oleidesulfovibrio alaskensis G20]|jgi:BioD-like phosphotransacetylase family protein|uniref:DRTGG domain protein n=1 Tax=Oleidesulfovibrio alaskensis (strain ATCC BAA-1058 / DSM 17464 / G20) TaxID=207559 RepID=Q30WA9_OLEA2|nr:DRTGG domain-containing protein [Oleidesulfovibrio alaskensis]ABB40037.1 DRTGG domain protein [Oleidesulfovibrio alaskensis G20]MBG0773286.1 phosphotransacetylase family protein [Oleidesulfovibrio alaskensis]MBL3581445.1 phosphotransacetylase family protein [Oleidesulfovibrio alaskensis]